MAYYRFDPNDPIYDDADKVDYYMNGESGSVDTHDGWVYEDENGEERNGVEDGLVFKVKRVYNQEYGYYSWEPEE